MSGRRGSAHQSTNELRALLQSQYAAPLSLITSILVQICAPEKARRLCARRSPRIVLATRLHNKHFSPCPSCGAPGAQCPAVEIYWCLVISFSFEL